MDVADMFELDPEQCRTCGGDLMLLGQLGRLLHFRCRHCGIDCSRPIDVDPADLREDN